MKSLLKIVEKYDGTNDISNWLDQLKMLKNVQDVKEELYQLIPLFLKGDAYELYSQLDENVMRDNELLEKALRKSFGIDSFEAFETLRNLRWQNGDCVAVFLAKIRRYASACDIKNDSFILHSFITGLPEAASRQLRTQVRIDEVSIGELVEKAKVILKDLNENTISMPMPSIKNTNNPKCFNCGRFGHTSNFCKVTNSVHHDKRVFERQPPTCFRCGEKGHVSARCRINTQLSKTCFRCGYTGHVAARCHALMQTENESGKFPAPVASQQD